MSKIDLGRKPQDLVTILGTDDGDKTHYPTLHLDGDARLADLPDSGTCTIKYKIRHKTHEEHKEKEGKKHSCSVTMDVLSIDPPTKAKKKNGDSDGGARKAFSDYFKDK